MSFLFFAKSCCEVLLSFRCLEDRLVLVVVGVDDRQDKVRKASSMTSLGATHSIIFCYRYL
jgi:hypothetical protein